MFQKFNVLTEDARKIREEVFIEEQGFKDEFDKIDDRAVHVVFYENKVPAAVCRYYKGEEDGEYIAGRIAIRRKYRGIHLGNHIMEVLEKLVKEQGGKKISLSAQMRVKPFYEKNGFTAIGEPYLDEYCEHIHMEKII